MGQPFGLMTLLREDKQIVQQPSVTSSLTVGRRAEMNSLIFIILNFIFYENHTYTEESIRQIIMINNKHLKGIRF